MQYVLTIGFDALAVSAALFTFLALASHLKTCWHRQPLRKLQPAIEPTPEPICTTPATPEPAPQEPEIPTPQQPISETPTVEPVIQPEPLQSLNTHELRRIANRRGITWKNAHGKNKHLRKDELLMLLAS